MYDYQSACQKEHANVSALLEKYRSHTLALREMEIAEIPLPRHCERSVAIHATVVRDHGSPRFARDDETGMFVISDSLKPLLSEEKLAQHILHTKACNSFLSALVLCLNGLHVESFNAISAAGEATTVSYTHLTLPT